MWEPTQNLNQDLIREMEEMIRPGGGLQVMEPSSSAVNADGNEPVANVIFEGLRRQLDDMQE